MTFHEITIAEAVMRNRCKRGALACYALLFVVMGATAILGVVAL